VRPGRVAAIGPHASSYGQGLQRAGLQRESVQLRGARPRSSATPFPRTPRDRAADRWPLGKVSCKVASISGDQTELDLQSGDPVRFEPALKAARHGWNVVRKEPHHTSDER
jgi:hypothetical protein